MARSIVRGYARLDGEGWKDHTNVCIVAVGGGRVDESGPMKALHDATAPAGLASSPWSDFSTSGFSAMFLLVGQTMPKLADGEKEQQSEQVNAASGPFPECRGKSPRGYRPRLAGRSGTDAILLNRGRGIGLPRCGRGVTLGHDRRQ